MIDYENFWLVSILRGVLALLIGASILVVPDMTRTLLFLPFALAFVILSLAAYGVADSILVFITSFFTSLRPARLVLRLQSVAGLLIGVLFCSIFFDRIKLEWFLDLIVLQAFATFVAEFMIASHTSSKHGSRWTYATAWIALFCAIGYAVAAQLAPADLTPHQIAFLAYAYLGGFGVVQLLTASRMLYVEYHANRLAQPHGQSLS